MRLLQKNIALRSDLKDRGLWQEFMIRAEEAFRRNRKAGPTMASRTAMAEMASLGKLPLEWVDRVRLTGQPAKRPKKIREAERKIEQVKQETAERLKRNEAEVLVVAKSLEVDPSQGGVIDPVKSGQVDVDWENTFSGKKSVWLRDAEWAYSHQSCKSVCAKAAPSAIAYQLYRDMKESLSARLDVMKVILGAAARKDDGKDRDADEFRGTSEWNLLEEMAKVK